jgi:hypothetical protein
MMDGPGSGLPSIVFGILLGLGIFSIIYPYSNWGYLWGSLLIVASIVWIVWATLYTCKKWPKDKKEVK